jgi:amidohydrolase
MRVYSLSASAIRIQLLALAGAFGIASGAWAKDAHAGIDAGATAIEDRVRDWRRHIHAHPELGNREFETAAYVERHLRALGLTVRTGIAHTGVVGLLETGRPGPVVALRADMDALPVTEQTDVPFASRVRTTYNGEEVGVMHACGHDAHTAILMGVAEVLAGLRAQLRGTILFVFQPAEELPPPGEEGGARLMLAEGVFGGHKPAAMFGLHVWSGIPTGVIGYTSGAALAAFDNFEITVRGRQTHAAAPWSGVDPIVVGSQIVTGLQTLVSRQLNIANAPAVVTVGTFHAGNRHNIVPAEAHLTGTVRTLDEAMRAQALQRIERLATGIAASGGAEATVEFEHGYPVTVNDARLTAHAVEVLRSRMAGIELESRKPLLAAEDFAYFAQTVSAFFFFLGVTPPEQDPAAAPSNHSPLFHIDEAALVTGVRALAHLAADALEKAPPNER